MAQVEKVSGCRLKPEMARCFSARETVTIFDWDDTLFASSEFEEEPVERTVEEQEDFEEALEALQRTAVGLLKAARKLSRVFIVTNANMSWVNEVCEKWMPGVGDFLRMNDIRILSARDLHEGPNPERSELWKVRAFRDILSVSRYTVGTVQNLIVIGDGREEHEAARALRRSERGVCVKMVKMPNVLRTAQLARFLAKLTMIYRDIVAANRDLEVEL
eukprot:Plantae.Rhodophyta-Purpureofilum_apyrenoidigerum.ctg2018.p1 GENE.Plantae.Rhodophyta-Purpureofilum_apyrenoidigerum.ctg2018~~Plantae.Rhodophyta-Purpureofilum_apyrenoidigerum.ctg2018.p1  ORF type:complete len:228 (+),score=52.22 Plantae.Rhodophyta-Purpureofilum_apyrenoidigerum.ctg2018:31-684(+)